MPRRAGTRHAAALPLLGTALLGAAPKAFLSGGLGRLRGSPPPAVLPGAAREAPLAAAAPDASGPASSAPAFGPLSLAAVAAGVGALAAAGRRASRRGSCKGALVGGAGLPVAGCQQQASPTALCAIVDTDQYSNISQTTARRWMKLLSKKLPLRRTGRRGRLGVPGFTCMLTGETVKYGFLRTYSEKRTYRTWKPDLHWYRLWWEREQKWVRLYITVQALWKVDEYGLEEMANRAGLDLYAWCREPWEPGSRQPLPLKVALNGKNPYRGKRPFTKPFPNLRGNALQLWPKYMPYLNKGMALADRFSQDVDFKADFINEYGKWTQYNATYVKLGDATPPKEPPKPLEWDKAVDALKVDRYL